MSAILSIIALIITLINSFFIIKIIKSITSIIGPKLDDQEKRYIDLIKKLKKAL